MLWTRILLVAITCMTLARAVQAQDSATESEKDLALATSQNDPTYSDAPTQSDSGVVIDLSEEDSSARLRLGFPVCSGTLGLTVEAPIDKDNKRSDVINRRGFANNVNLGIDYTWLLLRSIEKRSNLSALHEKKLQACRAYFDQLDEDETNKIKSETENLEDFKEAKKVAEANGQAPLDILIEYRCAFDTGDKYDLGDQMIQSARKNPTTSWAQTLISSVLAKRSALLLSIGAKVGVTDFDFVELDSTEPSGVSDASLREEPRSVQTSIGYLWGDGLKGDKVLWLTYQGSTSFEDADSAEICTPIGDSGLESCSDKPFGPPIEKSQELLIAEFRTFIGPGGLAFRAFYDFELEKAGGQTEFYFIRNKAGNRTGGVRVEWQEGEGTSGSIFLTQGFNFGPNL